MAYSSPYGGAYGAGGQSALPAGFMEAATSPGRSWGDAIKRLGDRHKEAKEKSKHEAKVAKTTRALAMALSEELEMDESQIERADADTLAGKIAALGEKRKGAEQRQSQATMKLMQGVLGGQADAMRARQDYGEEPGGPPGGPLSAQEQNKLRAIESMMPLMEGADPSMIDTILSLSQGGGVRAGETFTTPSGAEGMYTSAGGGSAALISGPPKPPTALEDARKELYEAQAEKSRAGAKSERLYQEQLNQFAKGVAPGGADDKIKKEIADLKSQIEKAEANLNSIEELGNSAQFIDFDDGEVDKEDSRTAQGASSFWPPSLSHDVLGKGDAIKREKEIIRKARAKLRKLSGSVPKPPSMFEEDENLSPENLFKE